MNVIFFLITTQQNYKMEKKWQMIITQKQRV